MGFVCQKSQKQTKKSQTYIVTIKLESAKKPTIFIVRSKFQSSTCDAENNI